MVKSRSDLISKKLGELLLQGYRMLNATCPKCDVSFLKKILINKFIKSLLLLSVY